ncbi:hypothetical protein NMG60_11012534 [Bertholletia excelsa]
MSKKKASGGATTMTLKDFHGGSIPSDLPLPSAPGVIVRPSDRMGFDRQGSWGNPIGRSDHRLRPGSAGSVRNFDDKTPFLCPSAHIGRNFDEDERKPLDGASGPRRTVSDDSIRALPQRTELKPHYSATERVPSAQILSPTSQLSGNNSSSYAGRVAESPNVGGNSQNFGGTNTYSSRFAGATNAGASSFNLRGTVGQAASGTFPNAWVTRKEAVSTSEALPAAWSGLNAASKLAHASALEKVSSGRWQSKQSSHHHSDDEVIRHTGSESGFYSKGEHSYSSGSYHTVDVEVNSEHHDAMLAGHAETSSGVDHGMHGSVLELPAYERDRSCMFPEKIEGKPPSHIGGVQLAYNDGKSGRSELQSQVPSEQSERPKLKLLPRSKPLESVEPIIDYQQRPWNSDNVGNVIESSGHANPIIPGLGGSDSGHGAVGRPKLNLKPRSQATEPSEGNLERERNNLFGGARPRELVLKERGIGDGMNNDDMVQSLNRVKQDVPRIETFPAHANPTRLNEKSETVSLDNRIKKYNDGRDNRFDVERTDMQRERRNRQNENWRNNREAEKLQYQQPQERPPSPETWRKPVEQQPKPTSLDTSKLRHGKATTAVELAQAFSRSVSDPK